MRCVIRSCFQTHMKGRIEACLTAQKWFHVLIDLLYAARTQRKEQINRFETNIVVCGTCAAQFTD